MKVLVAVDGSIVAEKAFDWYLHHLHKASNELVVVHASDQPKLPTMHFTVEGIAFPSDQIRKIIEESIERMKLLQDKYDMKCSETKTKHKSFFQIGQEKPGERIIAVAENQHCDVIVVGSRGLGGIRRTILGSVSDYVIHHSKIPVVVCPIA